MNIMLTGATVGSAHILQMEPYQISVNYFHSYGIRMLRKFQMIGVESFCSTIRLF